MKMDKSNKILTASALFNHTVSWVCPKCQIEHEIDAEAVYPDLLRKQGSMFVCGHCQAEVWLDFGDEETDDA